MLGFRVIKIEPTEFFIRYKRGKVGREGAGLALRKSRPTFRK